MKKILFLAVLTLGGLVMADYVEVKTGYGRNYYNAGRRASLYVCYVKRVKYVSDNGGMYLRYDGCGRYRDSCGSNGLAHFGHYPSVRAARRALNRCQYASPRFVD